MSSPSSFSESAHRIAHAAAALRALYDRANANAERAKLRRCAELADVLSEPAFWSLVNGAGPAAAITAGDGHDARRARRILATLALAFSAAPARESPEPFGKHLARTLIAADKRGSDVELAKGTPRLRRLLASRDDNDLARQLRAILRLATAKAGGGHAPAAAVHWPTLARDLLGGLTHSRVRWSEGFFAGDGGEEHADPAADIALPPSPAPPMPPSSSEGASS